MLGYTQMLQMPHAITRRGGRVFVVDKWGQRGIRHMQGRGLMDHWIVSNAAKREPRQTLGVIVNGHSTLPGPLANFYVGWDGEIGCVAALSANHGGVGSWRGFSGNHLFAGVEAEGPPLTAAAIEALAVLGAAFYDVSGQHPRQWVLSHQEYAPGRKIDIGPAIHQVRARAIYLIDNHVFAGDKPDTTPNMEEPEMLSRLMRAKGQQDVYLVQGNTRVKVPNPARLADLKYLDGEAKFLNGRDSEVREVAPDVLDMFQDVTKGVEA